MRLRVLFIVMICATWLQAQPRIRIIIDKDFSGDPDGLFQLVHHVLSPSVEIRGIIGSHLGKGAGFDESENSAANACKKVHEVLRLMDADTLRVVEGASMAMTDADTPIPSLGSQIIIDEAMRSDTSSPLYILCGAGLTNIASAYRQCIYSMAEMETKIRPCSKIGEYLYSSIATLMAEMKR